MLRSMVWSRSSEPSLAEVTSWARSRLRFRSAKTLMPKARSATDMTITFDVRDLKINYPPQTVNTFRIIISKVTRLQESKAEKTSGHQAVWLYPVWLYPVWLYPV